ncbi:MAG: BamA/TamA family outer membrane protein [Flavobacteriaceae bacterium]
MSSKQLSFLITLLGHTLFGQVHAQELALKINTQTEANQAVVDDLGYARIFDEMATLEAEVERIKEQLYALGYVELRLVKLTKNQLHHTAELALGPKYSSVDIFGVVDGFEALGYSPQTQPNTTMSFVRVPMERLAYTLEQFSKLLADESYTFATVRLSNIKPNGDKTLRADLIINKGNKRSIQGVNVLGYTKFSKSFIKHFLGIKTQKPFSLERIRAKMELLDQLAFVRQKRPAEVLFTPDTTTVYLYLEKIKSNRFDGFLGFGSNEDTGAIEFDGYLDLTLTNNLNFGESFKLNYKSDENDQKTFDVALDLPYLFGSPIGSTLNLNIFKKDSTFTTTQQRVKLFYPLGDKQQIGVEYRNQQSNVVVENPAVLAEDFDSQFYGLNYQYIKRQKNDALFPIKSQLNFTAGLGQRSTTETIEQRHLQLKAHHILQLNPKNSIFLKLHVEDLDSKQYLFNELIRFGGINSIRGFEENSLFASSVGVLCSEYRYRLSPSLFVHSIIDAGYMQDAESNDEQLYGFGFGFGLRTNAGLLRFNYANGKPKNQTFNFSNSKIHLSLTTTF